MNARAAVVLLAAALGLFAAPSARAAGVLAECFAQYERGDYDDAAGCFLLRATEDGDRFDPHLLYNAGNAYHRAGRTGRAIWAYRMALLDLPRDGDLRANLETAREKAVDDLDPPLQRGPVARTLLAPYDSLSARELLLLGVVAWALFFVLATVRLHRPFPVSAFGALPLLGLIAALGLAGHLARNAQIANRPVGVVLGEEVTLRSGRDLGSVDLARLHEGAEVAVVDVVAGWVQVRLSDEVRGWMPAAEVALVRPADVHRGAAE